MLSTVSELRVAYHRERIVFPTTYRKLTEKYSLLKEIWYGDNFFVLLGFCLGLCLGFCLATDMSYLGCV